MIYFIIKDENISSLPIEKLIPHIKKKKNTHFFEEMNLKQFEKDSFLRQEIFQLKKELNEMIIESEKKKANDSKCIIYMILCLIIKEMHFLQFSPSFQILIITHNS